MKLKRLLQKPGLRVLLEDTMASLGGGVAVLDLQGNALLGAVSDGEPSSPVRIEGEVESILLGQVKGGDGSLLVARIISQFAQQEYEKRSVVRETLDRYKELTLLYGIAEKIATNMAPQEVGHLLLDHVLQRIKSDVAAVFVLSEEGRLEELVSQGCMAPDSRHQTLAIARQVAAEVMSQGRAEIINEAALDQRLASRIGAPASLMTAPLTVKDRVIGVMQVATLEHHSYTADDLRLLSSMAIQAAAVIENARLYDTLQDTFFSMVTVLAETIEMRDHYTGGHTRRVGHYSATVGKAMGLSEEDLDTLRLAASLHDIGKIGIHDEILRKPGRLTVEEYEQIKRHSEFGAEILSHVHGLRHIVPIVRGHHEQFNGNGYPDGLAGEEIPLLARIIAVADAFDAMASHRPYRKALPLSVALEELEDNKHGQFDPNVVEAFVLSFRKGALSV